MSGLLWFRKDLRIDDNPALCEAASCGVNQALFISTPKQWERHDIAPIQADFIERHLNQLRDQLQRYGIQLTHLSASTYDDQVTVLARYCQSHGIDTVYANKELELDENQRDEQIFNHNLHLVSFASETITQSEKYDPNGNFIRKYLTELEGVPSKHIHFPHDYLAEVGQAEAYWPPIVEHKQARLRALDFYK
ncbi:deoxyribodipyrimidine photo-lyase/cryptochrome family protein [Vibrio sp. S4M6]|uniref:deoxyribodipyrimidine photo-lyase n=1 Tax=Vibrio sinus TaxID=2946865 RepID=UPI00202A08A6|nr:deoxyribodipyrimidine photo-lyase [Vibrio sinus]MCL9782364.1 deoxyribodipyrimidine photo-lyase/cryptochrome family protein [Vibrio sinus]